MILDIACMSKNLFNVYRYRRKWGRRIEQVRHDLSSDDSGNLRDFAWQRRKPNPFHHEAEGSRTKRIILLGVFGCCLLLALGLFLFHPFFYVRSVTVSGVSRLSAEEMERAVFGTLAYKKFFVIPAQSFFMADVDEIRDVVKSRFPVAKVEVRKMFPNAITVRIEEKVSTVIYDNGKQYSYAGLDGKIVEVVRSVGPDEWQHETRIVSSTSPTGETEIKEEIISSQHIIRGSRIKKELGNFPIVYDLRSQSVGVNEAVLDPATVKGILSWFQYLSMHTTVLFDHIILKDELGHATIHTEQGWDIHVHLSDDMDEQFGALKLVLDKHVPPEGIRYVDVRYPGRVYWQ